MLNISIIDTVSHGKPSMINHHRLNKCGFTTNQIPNIQGIMYSYLALIDTYAMSFLEAYQYPPT